MVKYFSYRLFFVLVLVVIAGCSTEKNTVTSRAYHNLTSHYNVYFNGKESLRAGLEKINNAVEDDYSKVLPLFQSSNPATANAAISEMDNAIVKGSKLIQSHSITKKPKRKKTRSKSYLKFVSQEEFNNWVDEAYILMGKAYFYQHNFSMAIENFNYVVRKFEDDPSRFTANLWLLRCFTELERYVEAYELIQVLQDDKDFPKQLEDELAAATADYYGRQLLYAEGIPYLSIAVKHADKKEDRLRFTYVLAQWYQETGNPEKASEIFREVARMNPPYKMAFNAQINAAGTFTGTGGNAEKLKKELKKMLRDKKNLEFRDQIYFAMGNISMKEGNKQQALAEYSKSASLSSANMYQRALSCLTLAQLHFEELNYKNARSYYDSAMVVIDEKYPNYSQISDRYHSLTRLTDNLYTVEREDSLQRIAQMDETTRNALIDRWIAQAIEKEAKEKKEQAAQMSDRNLFRANENRFGLGQQQEGAGWYFYSPTTVAYGKVEFERLWGKRKLEDDWRRSDRRIVSEDMMAENPDSIIGQEPPVKLVTDVKSREFYTQNLPVTDSLMSVSHTKIKNALFNAGRIFKTEFSDYPRAGEAFEDLNKRYPDNNFALVSYFELWDLYTKMNNMEKADYYKNLVVNQYPDSKHAKYLLNPNYFIELEAKADSVNRLYQQAFLEFKNGQYGQAGQISNQILTLQPDSLLIPKIKFIRMIADGTQMNWKGFEGLLNDYIAAYPKAEPKPLAEKILKLIQDSTLVNYQKLVDSGYLNDQIQNGELIAGNTNGEDPFDGKFTYDEDLLHYFIIAYPKEANVDLNRLKFDIANYNIDHYTKVDFEIESQNLNNNTSLLLVRSLNDKEQALIYFRSIIKRRSVFQALQDVKYVNFVASSTNFREITSDKDYATYLQFFILNYSKFITGDFTDELLPEPEELMEKAKEEEEVLGEKGSFVTITPSDSKENIYTEAETGPQNFVIAITSPKVNLKTVAANFEAYHKKSFPNLKLSIQQQQLAGNQLLIVRPFKSKDEAIQYFTTTIATRELFKSLDTLGYRNFIITDANLKKMNETQKIAEYLTFFRAKYIGLESTQNKGTAPVKPAAPAPYTGPYKKEIDGVQSFVLIASKEEVNAEALTQAITQYNSQNYAKLPLKVTSSMLDDFRIYIKVEGFSNKETALGYLRALAKDQQVYGPLANANYRNFIITPANEAIFKATKNILPYMDFYKQFYLSK